MYLACPYSHPESEVREKRFVLANLAAGKLMKKGYIVFSPISHGHSIAQHCPIPTDWDYWKKFCTTYLSVCNTMFVLMAPGWEDSVGVKEEIKLAREFGIHVEFIST